MSEELYSVIAAFSILVPLLAICFLYIRWIARGLVAELVKSRRKPDLWLFRWTNHCQDKFFVVRECDVGSRDLMDISNYARSLVADLNPSSPWEIDLVCGPFAISEPFEGAGK